MTPSETFSIDELMVRLQATIGVPHSKRVSPVVSESDIRRWAIAVYFPEKPPAAYWDPTAARDGLVAPHEFNPFAWPIEKNQRMYTHIEKGPSGIGLNAGTEVEYFEPIRPGDIVTAVATPISVSEKPGRSGRMVFYAVEDVWTNQRNELIKKYRLTQVLM